MLNEFTRNRNEMKKLLCVIKMKLQKYTKREREQERENSNLNQVSLEKTFCSF